jgi:hypothetical protein
MHPIKNTELAYMLADGFRLRRKSWAVNMYVSLSDPIKVSILDWIADDWECETDANAILVKKGFKSYLHSRSFFEVCKVLVSAPISSFIRRKSWEDPEALIVLTDSGLAWGNSSHVYAFDIEQLNQADWELWGR